MKTLSSQIGIFLLCVIPFALISCSTSPYQSNSSYHYYRSAAYYTPPMPEHIDTHGQKLVLVDPNIHAWGAYASDGNLVHSGMATAGDNWCPDINQPCRTGTGTFHIQSLGGANCISSKFPLPNGGGLMPYCMYFNGGQALHGAPDGAVVEANISHGCVRMRIPDAEWLHNNFAAVGTKVVVMPY